MQAVGVPWRVRAGPQACLRAARCQSQDFAASPGSQLAGSLSADTGDSGAGGSECCPVGWTRLARHGLCFLSSGYRLDVAQGSCDGMTRQLGGAGDASRTVGIPRWACELHAFTPRGQHTHLLLGLSGGIGGELPRGRQCLGCVQWRVRMGVVVLWLFSASSSPSPWGAAPSS